MKRPSWIFSSRSWLPSDGDPSRPEALLGVAVTEWLGTRGDAPGALVRLADQRYALTGPILAVGSRHQLERYLRRRVRRVDARDWYAKVQRLLDAEAREASAKEGG